MKVLRSIVSVILVLLTSALVSCSSPTQAKIPTVYTPEKIAQLQIYAEPIETAREKMTTLKGFIESQNWVDTRTFIHGPLGELRQDMRTLASKLLPKEEKEALKASQDLFIHFERIDAAAKERNSSLAESQFMEALNDFETFLDLIPQNS